MNNQSYTNVRAVYHDGVLTILDPLALPDGAEVQLDIHMQEEARPRTEYVYPTVLVPAEALTPLIGIVEVGGDALADSEGLYDSDRD